MLIRLVPCACAYVALFAHSLIGSHITIICNPASIQCSKGTVTRQWPHALKPTVTFLSKAIGVWRYRHTICCECFHEYSLTQLNDTQFVQLDNIGYTLPCPSKYILVFKIRDFINSNEDSWNFVESYLAWILNQITINKVNMLKLMLVHILIRVKSGVVALEYRTSVVHMRDQRNIKRAFWNWTRFARMEITGQKLPFFKKKDTFWILLRAFRDHFQDSSFPQNVSPPQKKNVWG